ncbi:MAG: transglutaminase domain-containing protein [Planctomycetales bacterium]|nr:transglutaminase domain-containing protein [Planctomycetales bacterium]
MSPRWLSAANNLTGPPRSYSRVATLEGIKAEQLVNPQGVALRVYSQSAPGYLRGRAYESYRNRRWHLRSGRRNKWQSPGELRVAQISTRPTDGSLPTDKGQRLFQVAEPTGKSWSSFEVRNDPARGEVYFTPLDTEFIAAHGEYLSVDEHDVVRTGIDRAKPYRAFVPDRRRATKLTPELRQRLLRTPPEMADVLRSEASLICSAAVGSREKITAVATYFQQHYEYSIDDLRIPPHQEPLVYFLTQHPAAHCEFFASATALLLRTVGVPTRYVTGYVVSELESEYGDYWVARNRNAHAWVEAFDEQLGAWVIVESTPGMRLDLTDRSNLGRENEAALQTDRNLDVASLQRQRARTAWRVALLLCVLLSALVFMYIGLNVGRRRRHMTNDNGVDDHRAWRKRRAVLDHALRRHGIQRETHETLHQFAGRLRQLTTHDTWAEACASWYEEYANVIYAASSTSDPPIHLPHLPSDYRHVMT